MKYLLSLLLASLVFSSHIVALRSNDVRAQRSATTASNDLIGAISKAHITDGCGCTYSLKGNPKRTVYSDDFDGGVWMNIDGRDIKLKQVSSVSTPKGEVRRGQKTTTRYTAPGVTVTLNTVVGKDYGEGHDYTGTITVTKGTRQQTVNISGSCGC